MEELYHLAFNSKRRHEKLAIVIVVHALQNTQNFVISRCCFAEDGEEMYKDSKRTCSTIVLFIKPFAWWRSSCRRRSGFLNSLMCVYEHKHCELHKLGFFVLVINIPRTRSWLKAQYEQFMHLSIPAVSTPPSPASGNRGVFAHVVSPGGGTFTILSRPRGWAFVYLGATPGHLTHVFLKVPWMSLVEKTKRLWSNGLSVTD